MWKMLLPLILTACVTDDPGTKKASFNLKEACAKSDHYVVDGTPTSWDATVRWFGKDSVYHSQHADISLDSKGFALPCSFGVEGDPKPIITITFD